MAVAARPFARSFLGRADGTGVVLCGDDHRMLKCDQIFLTLTTNYDGDTESLICTGADFTIIDPDSYLLRKRFPVQHAYNSEISSASKILVVNPAIFLPVLTLLSKTILPLSASKSLWRQFANNTLLVPSPDNSLRCSRFQTIFTHMFSTGDLL